MRLFITIMLIMALSACTNTTNDDGASSSDTQVSQEDTALSSEDVEVPEAETAETTSAGDTTPETDVPKGE